VRFYQNLIGIYIHIYIYTYIQITSQLLKCCTIVLYRDFLSRFYVKVNSYCLFSLSLSLFHIMHMLFYRAFFPLEKKLAQERALASSFVLYKKREHKILLNFSSVTQFDAWLISTSSSVQPFYNASIPIALSKCPSKRDQDIFFCLFQNKRFYYVYS
jgi:hypothetical protein